MKKIALLSLIALLMSFNVSAQWGVAFHQSNLPFIGTNYQIGERFLPELRIGTDNFIETTAIELAINYKLVNKTDYEFYSGLGGRVQLEEGLVIPVGFNFYPLENKNFGAHIELAGILGEDSILRGSWGIRYRFE